MKCLFIHDAVFKRDEKGNLYNDGSFSEEVWERYTNIFEEFTVVSRCEFISSDLGEKFNFFDIGNKTFQEVESITSARGILRYKETKKIMEAAIKDSECVIIRMPSFNGIIAANICKRIKKPYVCEVVGCAWDSLRNYSNFGKIIAPIIYFLTKYYIYNASDAVYITKCFLEERYPTKGNKYVCSNVLLKDVDNERIKTLTNDISISTIAAIDVKYKGQEYVIKALSYLRQEGFLNDKNLNYYIVGPGNNTYLKDVAIKENVLDLITFVGPIKHSEIYDFLDKIDIYIQPSLAEAQGRSLIEAMSRRCACLCSDVGGMVELLPKNHIFERKNVVDLSNKIIDCINNYSDFSSESFEGSLEFKQEIVNNKRKDILLRIKEKYE